MGLASKMVSAFFESQDITVREMEENMFRVGWNFKGGSIDIIFDFDEDDEHVHLEGMNFVRIPEDKYDAMYKTVNDLNDTYKLVKFVLLTQHGQICARDDAVIQLDSCGEECFELMIRMVHIVEDAYPSIMKALYA